MTTTEPSREPTQLAQRQDSPVDMSAFDTGAMGFTGDSNDKAEADCQGQDRNHNRKPRVPIPPNAVGRHISDEE